MPSAFCDTIENKVTETEGKRYTVTSQLRIKPGSEDDYMEYTCQAKHKALQPDRPMQTKVQLSVLYPPGEPQIVGFAAGEVLRRGQKVELICRSRGGNPPAQLIWYKNDVQVQMAYRTTDRLSENTYTFVAEESDNKARLRCEANNIMIQAPLKKEIALSVLFAPTHVTISGASEARTGDVVSLQCQTAPSNPPAEIKWSVNGHHMKNTTSRTIENQDGGWATVSNISVPVEANKRSLVVICHGLNMKLTENVISTHTVNVLLPPSQPTITGYTEGTIIPAGSVQRLQCTSTGGNPLATLTWYKNDKKLNSATKTTDKSVSSELSILVNATDNQAKYRCEAQNSATEIPLSADRTLAVNFPPETVKIKIIPPELKPGIEATLICDSSSSNPPATISWWRDGIAVDGLNNATKPGLWGGWVSSLELKVNISQDMDGNVYTCQSANEALQRNVHEAIKLQVLYPPKFKPPPSSTVVGAEGEPLTVAMVATGNPMSISYTWTKDGLPILSSAGAQRIVSEGPILNITRLNRNDTGIYTCEAVNSQGSAMINISVVVEYGASIQSISENVTVSPGEEAMLSCTVEGKPLTEEHIRWERIGYDMTIKTSTTFANGTSYLHVKNALREDVGNFRCIADNRVANPTSRDVLLIVKFAPEIDKSPVMLRAAAGFGERARLPCRAQSAPRPKFYWSRSGQVLNVNQTAKFYVENKQIDALTYESILVVERVAANDYGLYECIVRNELGNVKEKVRLDVTSPPDPPVSLNVLNVTHDSVTVAWTPGFDGGMKANYRVRYREVNSDRYWYEDSQPNSYKLTIGGLRMNTLYVFSIMASNGLGSSRYLPDVTRAHTKDTPPSQPASSLGSKTASSQSTGGSIGASGIVLLVGVAAGICLVLLNIILIGCCIHRRTVHKRIKRDSKHQMAPSDSSLPSEGKKIHEHHDTQKVESNLSGLKHALHGTSYQLKLGIVVSMANAKKALDSANSPDMETPEMAQKAEIPSFVIFCIALAALCLLAVNAGLVTWFMMRKRAKGETLSSVSEKSDAYSTDANRPDYTDDTTSKSASTYLVENGDMPPPRYQKEGTLPPYPNNINGAYARTLPHPRHNPVNYQQRSHDDQMIERSSYVTAPSPGPPFDGSYYNMNSDRYLSYPPMDYSAMEMSTPPPPIIPALPKNTGTLTRMTSRPMVPPPDVTYHAQSIISESSSSPQHGMGNMASTALTGVPGTTTSSIPPQPAPKPLQGILKDPKRNSSASNSSAHAQALQQQLNSGAQLIAVQNPSPVPLGSVPGIPLVGSTFLGPAAGVPGPANVSQAGTSSLGNSLLIGTYDPSSTNLSSFNASFGFTDADGHLV
ncbi:nephrin [Anopheles darlingi]|uniref:Nephrin n=1 Tax=Anopheles darlingi TaxID=43151 RepID=W5JMT8_ANODA|nr:nephrin [Anopheles darlingi]